MSSECSASRRTLFLFHRGCSSNVLSSNLIYSPLLDIFSEEVLSFFCTEHHPKLCWSSSCRWRGFSNTAKWSRDARKALRRDENQQQMWGFTLQPGETKGEQSSSQNATRKTAGQKEGNINKLWWVFWCSSEIKRSFWRWSYWVQGKSF